jgi:hypothetical protein
MVSYKKLWKLLIDKDIEEARPYGCRPIERVDGFKAQ